MKNKQTLSKAQQMGTQNILNVASCESYIFIVSLTGFSHLGDSLPRRYKGIYRESSLKREEVAPFTDEGLRLNKKNKKA